MGVPKFYSWLRLKNRIFPGILQRNVPGKVSSLSIDLNGLLHRVAQTVFSYGEGYNPERTALLETMEEEELYNDYFSSLSAAIFNLFISVAPMDYIIIAVDGVAPMAKINQQRARRFLSSGSPFFNPNLISPGTEFMMRVDEFLQEWIAQNEKDLPPNIIYSSHLVPGEAEHKIFSFFRERPLYGVHAVSGLDADLIILALTLPETNFIILREGISDIVNVTNLKAFLTQTLQTPTAVEDFIFLSFLLGNDFLPNSPSLERLSEGIDKLLEIYLEVGKPLLKEGRELDYAVLKEILSIFPEEELLREEASAPGAPLFLSRSLIFVNIVNKEGLKTEKRLDFNRYSRYWYEQALGGRDLLTSARLLLGREPFPVTRERVLEMASKYLQGITWIWRYYQGENLNLGWFFPYHYAPLLLDLASALPDNLEGVLPGENPLSYKYLHPLQQLLAILPLSSLGIVPQKLEEVAYTYLADDFPEKAIVEDKANGASWHKTVLLPFLNEERLLLSTPSFSPEEVEKYATKNEILLQTTYTQTYPERKEAERNRRRGKAYPTKPSSSYPGRRKNWKKKPALLS